MCPHTPSTSLNCALSRLDRPPADCAALRLLLNTPNHNHGRQCSPLPLLFTLRRLAIRHTKDQTLDEGGGGGVVLQLPAKTIEDLPVVLNVEEAAAYRAAFGRTRSVWLTLAAAGARGAAGVLGCGGLLGR
jgi:hypothetical protein